MSSSPPPSLNNTSLRLLLRLMKITATDLGSPRDENYFANSRKQYFPHRWQQRQPLHWPLHRFLLCGGFLQSFEDKGQDSRKSTMARKSKADCIFCPQGLTATLISLINVFEGFCLWAPSLTKALKSDFCANLGGSIKAAHWKPWRMTITAIWLWHLRSLKPS